MTITLRPYQKDACRAAWMSMFTPDKPSGIINLPPGGGKTITGAAFIRAAQKSNLIRKVLWIAHRDELIKQANDAFKLVDPDTNIGIWNSKEKSVGTDITIAMIGSTKTLHKICNDFDLIVVDECHHNAEEKNKYTNTYQKLIKKINPTYQLGLTATPSRLDNKSLAYDMVYYQTNFLQLVADKYLARPIYTEMLTKDFYRLDKRGGKSDFTDKSLRKLNNPQRNKKIADQWFKNKTEYGQTIVFCVGVDHCHDLMAHFKKLSPNSNMCAITGTSSDEDRQQMRADMISGKLDVVFNCMVFTEGYDAPTVRTVIVARPTMSDGLFMQMSGRGSRKMYDQKGVCTKDSYHLVVVMDDITKFSTLVQDWAPALGGEATVDEETKHKRRVSNRKTAYEEACNKLNVSPKLMDAKMLDIIYVLCFSTRYNQNVGIPVDQDRADCLVRMTMFANDPKCWINEGTQNEPNWTFNQEKLIQSYTSCVLNGEFPRPMWEKMCWAFFFKHILKRDTVRVNGKNHNTWKYISLIDFNDEMANAQQKRIKIDYDAAKKANEDYNDLYGGNQNGRVVLQKLLMIVEKNYQGKPALKSVRRVIKHVKSIESNDRIITIKTSLPIRSNRDPNIRTLFKSGEKFTDALQEFLDDSCCTVVFKANKTGGS